MSKVWLKSYTPEIESLVEAYYHKAFRRNIPNTMESITLLSKKELKAKSVKAGLGPSPLDGFLDTHYDSNHDVYNIYSRRGFFEDIIEILGHELFHLYLREQIHAGKVEPKNIEDYVIDEAFAQLGSWYFHGQLYNDDKLREAYSVKEFDKSLPRAKEHRRGYMLTNILVEMFYPRYFTPVKRLLLEATIDEIADVSGLHK
ncbi:MAG: hypothetical protein AABY09_03955, partial [Nanoarchaeota archaeon]